MHTCHECGAALTSVYLSRFCAECGWRREAQEVSFALGRRWCGFLLAFPVLFLAFAPTLGAASAGAATLTVLLAVEWLRCWAGLRRIRQLQFKRPQRNLPSDDPEEQEQAAAAASRLQRLRTMPRPRPVRLNGKGWLLFAIGVLGPIMLVGVLPRPFDEVSLYIVAMLVIAGPICAYTLFHLQRQISLIRFGEVGTGTVSDVVRYRIFIVVDTAEGDSLRVSTTTDEMFGDW